MRHRLWKDEVGHHSLGLRNCERGSVYIEMIFFIPMAALLWILLNFAYDAKKTAVHTQRDARECAWQYAMGGCEGNLPAKCSGGGVSLMYDADILASAGSSFATVAKSSPWAAPYLTSTSGRYFTVKAEEDVSRPSVLGGSTTAEGRFAIMCADDPPVQWTTPTFFKLFCEKHSKWCP